MKLSRLIPLVVFGSLLGGIVTTLTLRQREAAAGRNSSGTYVLPAGNPVISGAQISSTWANNTFGDVGTALTDSLSRSGLGAMQASLSLIDGNAAVPSLNFASQASSGLYKSSISDVRASIAGLDTTQWTSTSFNTLRGLTATNTQNTAALIATAGGGATPTRGAISLTSQNTPSSPTDGDIWYDTTVSPARFTGRSAGVISGTVTAITLNAGLTAANGLGFWKDFGGIVHFKGEVINNSGGAVSNLATTTPLPAGFRPAFLRILAAVDTSIPPTLYSIGISTTGTIVCTPAIPNTGVLYLDGINYLAEG